MLLFLAAIASASTPSAAIRAAVAQKVGVVLEDVEVHGVSLPTAPADADWIVDLPTVGPVWGEPAVVLHVGTTRFVLRPHVTVWQTLPVAAQAASAGEPVSVTTARVARDTLRGAVPVDATHTWEARVDLAAGAPLTTSVVRARPDGAQGQQVRIVAGQGPLSVQAPGQLGEDAFVGDRVHVVNLATRTQLVGTYQADGSVLVGGLP